MKTVDRVMVLGVDGATWTVLDAMRARGAMPNLDALLERSASGTLRSIIPPVTTAAWTSMMTGCGPARHGVFDHRYYDATQARMKVNHSGRIRVPTLWHLLTAAGRASISLNLPGLYPPPPINGFIIPGMDAPHLDAAVASAPAFAARRAAEAPGYGLGYFWKRVPETLEELKTNAQKTADSFLGRADGGWLADSIVPDWSVLLVQFQNLDPFQHRAWRFLNVDETGIDRPDWNKAAMIVIAGLDRAIGRLCELADRKGAAVLMVSDHGFGSCLGRVNVNRILIDAGVVRMPGLLGRIEQRAFWGLDRLRQWGERREDRKARGAAFDRSVTAQYPFDWKRTLAFAPHQDTAAMVYVNSAARNKGPANQAPTMTPRQVDDARASAANALATARHPETGKPLFTQIIHTAAEFQLDPAEQGYPDLIAVPDAPYWIKTKLGASRSWLELDPGLPGTHRPQGVVSLAGAGLKQGRWLDSNLIDAAPTILALLGMPVPDFMEGQPIAGIAARALESRVHSPETPVNGPHARPFEYTEREQEILEQRLADLGYLE